MAWEDLPLPTKVLWEHLCQMAWADGSCYPSTQTLATKLNLHLRVIKRSKSELVSKNLIHVFHRPNSQTDVIFPFVRFRNIEQRDRNISVLSSVILSLPGNNENNNLEKSSVKSETDQCHIVTPSSVILSPIKENIKRTNKKEEVHTSYVCDERSSEHEHVTAEPVAKTKVQLKREKAEARQQQRESQLAEIRSNIDSFKTKYPDIDVEDLIRRLDFWLHNDPTGKTRVDINRTWKWWLNKEQSRAAMRKKFKTDKTKSRSISNDEFDKYLNEYVN